MRTQSAPALSTAYDCGLSCAGKPAVAGKKLVATAAKSSATPPVAPSKTPSKGVLQKAGLASNGQTPKAEEGKAKGKAKGSGSEAEKAPKAPRAKNAYMFFTADKRDAVKGE